MKNSLYHITNKIKIFICGFIMSSALYQALKIACLHSLRSWAIYFDFCLAGKMMIYTRLRLAKIIF